MESIINIKLFFKLALLLLSLNLFPKENVLEYPYRDIKSPIINTPKFEKIFILSPMRTGSTLAYMIFQYLFETNLGTWNSLDKTVVKSHSAKECLSNSQHDSKALVVVTIRNPKDAFLSLCKIQNLDHISNSKQTDFLKENKALSLLRYQIIQYKEIIQFIESFPKERLLVLYYEDFAYNMASLLSAIENTFESKIPDEEITKIFSFFSKNEMRKVADRYKDFQEYDPIINIHGKHISTNNKQLSEIFNPKTLKLIDLGLNPIANYFGYDETQF